MLDERSREQYGKGSHDPRIHFCISNYKVAVLSVPEMMKNEDSECGLRFDCSTKHAALSIPGSHFIWACRTAV